MAKQLLRSGSLDAVLPLGENGQPVYLSALQLRETLRLRKQLQIADCLAIPQPNDAGDRLDWYSPVSGKITSWNAATDSARAHALNQLLACQQAIADICMRARQSGKTSHQLFGALLAKALQFPDQNFVYLVGGKPVLTFWGFVSLEKKSPQDSLDCLRPAEEELPLTLAKKTAAAPLVASASANAVPEPEPPAIVAPEAKPEAVLPPPLQTKTDARPDLLRYGWMLPAAALLVVFGVQMKGYFSNPQENVTGSQNSVSSLNQTAPVPAIQPEQKTLASPTPQTAPVPATQPEQKTLASPTLQTAPVPAIQPAPKILFSSSLPLAPASVSAIAQTAAPGESAPVTAPAAPDETAPVTAPTVNKETASVLAGKDDLVLPADAVKLGSTRFLNGSWRLMVSIKAPLTGKPPVLRYQLKNGIGQARMTQGDGTVCRADVYAGLMKSGNLVINSRTRAKCSDGTRYKMPELVCSQGAAGTAAVCNGQYDADTVLPMTMKRESKP